MTGISPCSLLSLWVIIFTIVGGGLSIGSADEPVLQTITVQTNLAYKTSNALSDYEIERCKLDLYLPAVRKSFPTLVWFHGGGLEIGSKDEEFTVNIAHSLAQSGIAVAVPNYRLSPKAKFPAYLDDAAAAVAFVITNIAAQGGDTNRVFIGGHSAGGYLTLMLGLDSQYLQQKGFAKSAIAGLIPVSGQTTTHSTIRAERGLNRNRIIADEAAPIYYADKETPPLLIFFAEHDFPMRVEENQLLVAALAAAGNTNYSAHLVHDRDHISIAENIKHSNDPVHMAIVDFIKSGTVHRQ